MNTEQTLGWVGRQKVTAAVTMGDPTGLGGELVLRGRKACVGGDGICFGVLDSPKRLERLSKRLDCGVQVITINHWHEVADAYKEGLPVIPLPEEVTTLPGDKTNDKHALLMTIEAIKLGYEASKKGEVTGLLTNPIDKGVLAGFHGWTFKGHTDFLCHLDGRPTGAAVMMLEGGTENQTLRVVPATVHLSLREAINAVTFSLVESTVKTTVSHLQEYQGLMAPLIGVTGLNPHAGEGGLLGVEEQQQIEPAIKALQQQGYQCSGPHSADTMFIEENRWRYNAIVCMIHDQALIAIKSLYFHNCVNVTLGLSVLRASPAHGVGRDVVGRGTASLASWERAMVWLANTARRNKP